MWGSGNGEGDGEGHYTGCGFAYRRSEDKDGISGHSRDQDAFCADLIRCVMGGGASTCAGDVYTTGKNGSGHGWYHGYGKDKVQIDMAWDYDALESVGIPPLKVYLDLFYPLNEEMMLLAYQLVNASTQEEFDSIMCYLQLRKEAT